MFVWNLECLRSLMIVMSRKSTLSEGEVHVNFINGFRLLRSVWKFCIMIGLFKMMRNTSSMNLCIKGYYESVC